MLLIMRLVAVEECGATNEDAREASALIMTLRRSTERMWSSTVESSENESVASTINAISLRALAFRGGGQTTNRTVECVKRQTKLEEEWRRRQRLES